jgi:hypothetical protein
MNKFYITFQLFVIILTKVCYGQEIKPYSINSAGNSFSQSNQQIYFILGDLIVLKQTDSLGNSLGNGFVSGAVQSTQIVTITEVKPDVIALKIYPNPTNNFIFIEIEHCNEEYIYIQIINMLGNVLLKDKYLCIKNKIGIDFKNFTDNAYNMQITNSRHEILGSYKIIKTD